MLAVVPFFLLLSSIATAAPFNLSPRLYVQPLYTSCVNDNDYAITWNEGPPAPDSESQIDQAFAGYWGTTTYFVNGNNHLCIFDDATVSALQASYTGGHQIGSSGWSYACSQKSPITFLITNLSNADLTTMTHDEIDVEIGRLNDALSKILGVTPNFYRPPTLAAMNEDVASYLQSKYGMSVVTWSYDTNDLVVTDESTLIQEYIQNMRDLTYVAPITMAHAQQAQSISAMVNNPVGPTVPALISGSYALNLATVAECLLMSPYTTTTGSFGTKDASWTCADISSTASGTTTSSSTTSTDSSSSTTSTDSSSSTTSTTTTSTPAATPSILDSYNNWEYVSCFEDAVDARTLPNPTGVAGGPPAMTVELCLDTCHASGYTYAGLEWSQECYCGDAPPPQEATDGRCDMVCNGNPLEICGGAVGLSVYHYTLATTGPSVVQTYGQWTYSNCYEDEIAARQLPVPMAVNGAMTVELCLDACHTAGYGFAGVEWSQECYCGNALPATVATDGRCDMACAGNSAEICGGGLGLDVFQYAGATPTGASTLQSYDVWTSSGCYEDSVAARVLPVEMGVAGAMTVELCLNACKSAGYEFAGVEYAEECYCGRSLPPTPATDGRCDMACTGNSLEYCGGGNGINVYQASASASSPSVLQSYNGWSTSGCYVDAVDARTLPYTVTSIPADTMTVELCLDACSSLGYQYAGLEYSQECYCGAALPPQEATDGRCDMVCKGNALEYCGGGNGLNVYSDSTSSSTTTAPSSTTTTSAGTFTFADF